MKEAIFKIIDKFTEGVDAYHTEKSMWLIFTDKKDWVIELTNEGTLWYNYVFFTKCFKYTSLDVVDNQHYITEWVENTLQNVVRYSAYTKYINNNTVENTLQNGVKETKHCSVSNNKNSREALQNGIKITENKSLSEAQVKRVIIKSRALGQLEVTEKEINKVIKETHDDAYHNNGRIEGVINIGIKETNWRKVDNHPTYLDNIIDEGNCSSK